jgi:hypothetical protein
MRMSTNQYLSRHSPPGTLRRKTEPAGTRKPAVMTASESKARWTVRNAWRYAKALASVALRGETPFAVRLARTRACLSCPQLRSRTGTDEPIGWCAACGCGASPKAALSLKILMPGATCPKGRWTLPGSSRT